MTRYVEFQTADGGIILVEIEREDEMVETGVVKAGLTDKAEQVFTKARDTFEGAMMNSVRRNAEAFIQVMDELPKPPNEAELMFGLKATGDGDVAVVKTGAEATYGVKLTWKRQLED